MATIFSKIISGDIPGTFVWSDELCVAFLSINPLTFGHTLVVPRAEVDHWIDAPSTLLSHLTSVSQHIGKAQQSAFGCNRIGVILAGYEVPHLHIHVVPTNSESELSFEHAATSVERDDLERAAEAIRGALRKQGHDEVVA